LLFNAVLRRPAVDVLGPAPRGLPLALLNAAIDYALEDGSRLGGETALAKSTSMLLSEALKALCGAGHCTDGWLAAARSGGRRALQGRYARSKPQLSIDELAVPPTRRRTILASAARP